MKYRPYSMGDFTQEAKKKQEYYTLKIFKVAPKIAKKKEHNFFLTHRKTKNHRFKKFRYIEFMEKFNI